MVNPVYSRSHALRGNAYLDAPASCDVQRHRMRSHAGAWERGKMRSHAAATDILSSCTGTSDRQGWRKCRYCRSIYRPCAARGNADLDAPASSWLPRSVNGVRKRAGVAALASRDVERHYRRSHAAASGFLPLAALAHPSAAERGNEEHYPGVVFGGLRLTPNPPYELFGCKGNEE